MRRTYGLTSCLCGLAFLTAMAQDAERPPVTGNNSRQGSQAERAAAVGSALLTEAGKQLAASYAGLESGRGKSSIVAPVAATANGGAAVEMPLPYTIGMGDKTAPVEIELKQGKDVVKFHGPARVTVGEFVLTPVK